MKFKTDNLPELPKGTKAVVGITGLSLGLGMIGGSLGGTVGTQLGQAGVTSAGFISPAVSISMGGKVINMLKDFKKV